jgi:predicted oxidoreductase (fatty acid repression mutant protein)
MGEELSPAALKHSHARYRPGRYVVSLNKDRVKNAPSHFASQDLRLMLITGHVWQAIRPDIRNFGTPNCFGPTAFIP